MGLLKILPRFGRARNRNNIAAQIKAMAEVPACWNGTYQGLSNPECQEFTDELASRLNPLHRMSFRFTMWQNRKRGEALSKYGLRMEDVVSMNPDRRAALAFLTPEQQHARTKRLFRAIDLDTKHEYLPKELRALNDPYKMEYIPIAQELRARRLEKDLHHLEGPSTRGRWLREQASTLPDVGMNR
jgi:hypothetical protein